jgi:hypothetical protein
MENCLIDSSDMLRFINSRKLPFFKGLPLNCNHEKQIAHSHSIVAGGFELIS